MFKGGEQMVPDEAAIIDGIGARRRGGSSSTLSNLTGGDFKACGTIRGGKVVSALKKCVNWEIFSTSLLCCGKVLILVPYLASDVLKRCVEILG